MTPITDQFTREWILLGHRCLRLRAAGSLTAAALAGMGISDTEAGHAMRLAQRVASELRAGRTEKQIADALHIDGSMNIFFHFTLTQETRQL